MSNNKKYPYWAIRNGIWFTTFGTSFLIASISQDFGLVPILIGIVCITWGLIAIFLFIMLMRKIKKQKKQK